MKQTQVIHRRTYRPTANPAVPVATFTVAVTSGSFSDPALPANAGVRYYAEDGSLISPSTGLNSPLSCNGFPVSYRQNNGIGSYGTAQYFVRSFALVGSYQVPAGPVVSVSRYYVAAFNMNNANGPARWAKVFASPDPVTGWNVVVSRSSVADDLNQGDGKDEVRVVFQKPGPPPPASPSQYILYNYYDLQSGALLSSKLFSQPLP